MNDRLSLRRFAWLLRNEAFRNYRSWALVAGTVALAALLLSSLGAWDRNVGENFYQTLFLAALFGWGSIATSQAFADLHGRGTSAAFLLLPASTLEKTAARLVVHTVALFFFLLIFTTVLSFALEGINAALFGVRRPFFSPFDRTAWLLAPHYLVVQSLFFLGAAWFRKAHFVKTVGAVLAAFFGLCFIAVAIAWLFGPNEVFFAGRGPGPDFFSSLEWIAGGAMAFYYVVLPAFCWFVAWLRVTETQVSHGI